MEKKIYKEINMNKQGNWFHNFNKKKIIYVCKFLIQSIFIKMFQCNNNIIQSKMQKWPFIKQN